MDFSFVLEFNKISFFRFLMPELFIENLILFLLALFSDLLWSLSVWGKLLAFIIAFDLISKRIENSVVLIKLCANH